MFLYTYSLITLEVFKRHNVRTYTITYNA